MPQGDKILKILHMSDLHLGKILRSKDLAEDQEYILAQIVHTAHTVRPDIAIIAGDVFDRSIPAESAQSMFGHFMANLRGALTNSTKILVIPGNHDSPRRVAYAAELFEAVGIHLVSEVRLEPAFMLKKGEKHIAVWALPFVTHGMYQEFKRCYEESHGASSEGQLTEMSSGDSMAERLEEIIARMHPHLKDFDVNIIAAHCFVHGAALSESESAFIGGIEAVPARLFEDFDYAAIGHLHRMQAITTKLWYSGAPMAMSFGESGEKGVLDVEIEPGSRAVNVAPLALKPLHQLKRVRGSFAELSVPGMPSDEDYLEVVLTDAMPVYEAMNELAGRFPNLMTVRQEAYERTNPSSEVSATRLREENRVGSLHETVIDDFDSFAQCILEAPVPLEIKTAFESMLTEAEQELT